AIKNVRDTILAAFNTARALTTDQKAYIDKIDRLQKSEWIMELQRIVALLGRATFTTTPNLILPINGILPQTLIISGRGRRKEGGTTVSKFAGHLITTVEHCGGKISSNDHDPRRNTLNEIIRILQPHFRKGVVRPISAATFRRIKREMRAKQK